MIKNYKTIILDFDGTLAIEDKFIDGAIELIEQIQERGQDFFIVSNKTIFPKEYYIKMFGEKGISLTEDKLINALDVSINYLSKNFKGAYFFAIAEDHLIKSLEKSGLIYSKNNSQIELVVVSLDREISPEKLETASESLKKGARLFASNTDDTCPVKGGEIEDAGITLKYLYSTTGKYPEKIFGKPSDFMIDYILSKSKSSLKETLIIGDRSETDIKMANKANIDSILVKTGVKDKDFSQSNPMRKIGSIADLLN